ncbi:hypothetical protein ScPMuIL_001258 [Solemya velum]
MAAWYRKPIAGVLFDISGVLFESGASNAIVGSVDAIKRIKESGMPVRFCTNETQKTRMNLVEKLVKLGFDVAEGEVFPPAPAMCHILRQRNLRPHLLVHPSMLNRILICILCL